MTNGKHSLQWREVALELDALLRKFHAEIGEQIVKNAFVHGLVQEEKDAFGNEESEDDKE
tara:strand:- start:543 stop:722 length:180 start_codon:yes stop_codon:yes gene_type:complete